MHLGSALLTLSLSLSPSLSSTVADGAGRADRAVGPSITVDAVSAAWERRIEWGLERFRAAGLDLPAVAITAHRGDDKRPCEGAGGLYHPGTTPEVHFCSSSRPESRAAALLTLHELGHAWAESQLDAAQRQALLDLRGLDAWVDPQRPPHEWGAEHAAEILSWGLMDELVPIVRIEDAGPDRLRDGFRLLTGSAPLWSA